MLAYIRRLIFSLMFAVVDRIVRSKRNSVMISVQYSVLDADIKPLLHRLPETIDGEVYVCIRNQDTSTTIEENLHERISVVEPDNLRFLLQLATCRLVALQGPHHLHGYRFFWREHRRTSVLFYHGLITK